MVREITVRIPDELYDKMKRFLEDSGLFSDEGEFINYLLSEFFEEKEGGPGLTPEEEEAIKERLRALGYI